jgi:hypothetical protein
MESRNLLVKILAALKRPSTLRFAPVEMTFKGQENREKSPYPFVD